MRLSLVALLALLVAPGALAGQGKDKPEPPKPPCEPTAGRALIRGTLVDSTTALPLDGAGIVLRWGAELREKKEGETDHQGRFRLCDAPLGTTVTVQANFWGGHTQVQVTPTDTTSAPLALRLDAPHSLLGGHVVGPDGKPVEGAAVRLEGLVDPRITSPEGAFSFGLVPSGSYALTVEHLAFTTVVDTVDVDVSTGVDATIHVAPGVIAIAPISVVVRSLVLERRGFYERQKYGHGQFVTRQQIEAQHLQESADILARMPGVRIQAKAFGDRSVATARAGCPMRYVVDGARTTQTYSMDFLTLGDIEGVEVYLGPSQVPTEFSAFPGETGGSCGLVIVWTRQNLKL